MSIRFGILALAAAVFNVYTAPAAGGTRVTFELATETGFPAASAQQWYQVLTDLGVDGLQIRGARAGDKPGIETGGSEADPTYRVTGLLTARNELVLPGGKFSPRDRDKLLKWLTRLREQGAEAAGGKTLPFGLPARQLEQVQSDLARPVDFDTRQMSPEEALARIAEKLEFPLTMRQAAGASLAESPPVAEELRGVSSGTALSYLLRPAGLVLEPRLTQRRQVEYEVQTPSEGKPFWPVGWPGEVRERELLPKLFDSLEVELDDVPLAEALEAIGERLDLPILFDHHALVREGIDVHQARVSLPASRSIYSLVLRKILHQARLTSELRVDDAGRPILWVTTIRKPKRSSRTGGRP